MRFWTFFSNVLADLKLAQAGDEPRTQDQAEQQRRNRRVGGPKREISHHVQNFQRRPILAERIQEFEEECIEHYRPSSENAARNAFSACSSFTPRDPLIRITSPSLTVPASNSPASVASEANFSCSALAPASRAPSRISRARPCTAMMRAAPARTASRPHTRCSSAASFPSSSISPATIIFLE